MAMMNRLCGIRMSCNEVTTKKYVLGNKIAFVESFYLQAQLIDDI